MWDSHWSSKCKPRTISLSTKKFRRGRNRRTILSTLNSINSHKGLLTSSWMGRKHYHSGAVGRLQRSNWHQVPLRRINIRSLFTEMHPAKCYRIATAARLPWLLSILNAFACPRARRSETYLILSENKKYSSFLAVNNYKRWGCTRLLYYNKYSWFQVSKIRNSSGN